MVTSVLVLFLLLALTSIDTIYQSHITFSPLGKEFQPKTILQELATMTAATRLRCSALCNSMIACRTMDYDPVSRRCRLFEGDITTGSLVTSSSPSSVVGTVRIIGSLFIDTHAQPCSKCQETRYEICSANTSSCQCPIHTYWNGKTCELQLLENDACTQADACRSDLNLTCQSNCYGEFSQCMKRSNGNFCSTKISNMVFSVS
jgi:hypothetical protein